MATDPKFDAVYKQIASNIAAGKPGAASGQIKGRPGAPKQFDTSAFLSSFPVQQQGEYSAPEREGQWSLGKSFIDFLSTTSYGTAGVVNKIGQNLRAAGRGEIGGALDLINPLSVPGAFLGGIAEKRSNIQNLVDAGVNEKDAAVPGLAMDIALDPLWLIPGGAIAAGIKGTTRGAVTAAGASRQGVKFSKEAFDEASRRIKELRPEIATSRESIEKLSPLRGATAEPIADLFQPGQRISNVSGTGISNLLQGIRQGNIENYAEWAALRRMDKASKAVRQSAKKGEAPIERFKDKFKIDPRLLLPAGTSAAAKAVDNIVEKNASAVSKPDLQREIPDAAAEASDVIENASTLESSGKFVDDLQKDANAVNDVIDNALEATGISAAKSINSQSREVVAPVKDAYLKKNGMPASAVDADTLAKVSASPFANDIGEQYDRLKSDPTNPQVLASYTKAAEEVEDQFYFLTKDPAGPKIDVRFVDEDPYQVNGVTDSRLVMQDIVDNKRLLVYKTADDQVHPIWSKDTNNKFRAVHDYFGHAASGRGFLQDGEEAAWISHSTMFSPLARKAMTTETRGQNSWVNRFGLDENGKPVRFAEQKAALLPDAYVMMPAEYQRLEDQVSVGNGFIARSTATIHNLNDIIMDDAKLIVQPLRGYQYNQKDFASISKFRDEIVGADLVRPNTEAHSAVLSTLGAIRDRVAGGARLNVIGDDLAKLGSTLTGDEFLALNKILNDPVDATDLLINAAKAEGRTLDLPKPFKPTVWGPQKGYSKPAFSVADVERFFPNDPILGDPRVLDLAMGVAPASKVRALKGETKEQALVSKQTQIWEDFRVRNEALIKDAAIAQRADWDAANNIPNSELFTGKYNNPIGLGKLPLGIPRSAVNSLGGGHVTIRLGALLESIQSTVIREPIRAVRGTGGLETTIAAAIRTMPKLTKKDVATKGQETTLSDMLFPEDQVLDFVTSKVRGARFDVVDANGLPIPDFMDIVRSGAGLPAGAKLVAGNEAAQAVIARLKQVKSAIEIDRIPPVIQDWVTKQLDSTIATTSKSNIQFSRAVAQMDDTEIAVLARQLMDATPSVKSFADAQMFIRSFDKAMASLAKKPKRNFFVKTEDMLPTTGALKNKIDRDIRTGAPIGGAPISEEGVLSRSLDISGAEGRLLEGGFGNADATLLTTSGAQFTGRVDARGAARDKFNRGYESQLENGKQQLASVSNVKQALDRVAGAIVSKELPTSPEQADLLRNILGSLGKKMAPDASPRQVFDEFEKNARILYDDIIRNIESAAKKEAVIAAAPRAFTKSIKENLAIIEAIDKTDPGELQRKVMQFTEDAVLQVDEACSARGRTSPTSPSDFLERVVTGQYGI